MRANALGIVTVVVLTAASALAGEWYVPAAAHAEGAEGSVWRTDLVVRNAGGGSAEVTVALLPQNRDNRVPAGETTLTVPAGATLERSDVVDDLFGARGAAALRLTSASDALEISTRTYNLSDTGTFGQSIPAVPEAAMVAPGVRAVLLGLSGTGGRRSNVGWVNGTADPVTVVVDLFADDGGLLARRGFVTVPYGQRQLNDVFAALGVDPVDGAYARVSADGWFQPYASVVAAVSNDPIYVPAQTGTAMSTELLVSAAARVDGALGTSWRTDLWLLNEGSSTAEVAIELWHHGRPNPSPETATLNVEPGQMLTIEDAMMSLFATDGLQGAVAVRGDQLLVATSRTYNTTSAETGSVAATYGQFIPAIPVESSAGIGETMTLIGARVDDDFRSNLGLVATTAGSEIALVLRDADGAELATRQITLGEREPLQASLSSGALFGLEGYSGGTVEVTLTAASSPDAGLTAYLSQVDNLSSDPTFAIARLGANVVVEPEAVNELVLTAAYVLGSSVEATEPAALGKSETVGGAACVSIDRTGDTLRRGESPIGKCWQGTATFDECAWSFPAFSFALDGLAESDVCIVDGYRSSFVVDLVTVVTDNVGGTSRQLHIDGDLGVTLEFTDTWIEDVTLDGPMTFTGSSGWVETWTDLTWAANPTGYVFIPVGVLQVSFPYDGVVVHATAYFDGSEWVTVEVQAGVWHATFQVNILTGQVQWP